MKSKWLLALYPEMWRNRYQDEFAALLEQCPASPRMVIDVLTGAIDAQLNLDRVLGQQLTVLFHLRRSIFSIVGACILFLVGVWIFNGTVDDSPFATAMSTHQELAVLWVIMEIGGGLAAAVLLISGVPIGVDVFKGIVNKQRRNLWLVLSPMFSVISLSLYIVIVTRLIDPVTSATVRLMISTGFWVFFWGSIVITALCLCSAIRRSDIRERAFRFSLMVNRATTLVMGSMVVAAVLWFFIVRVTLADLFNTDLSFLTMRPGVSFAVGIIVMFLSIGIMCRSILKSVVFNRKSQSISSLEDGADALIPYRGELNQ